MSDDAAPSILVVMIYRCCLLLLLLAVTLGAQEPAAVSPPLPSELLDAQGRWTEARSLSQTAAEQRRAQAKTAYLTGLANFEKQFLAGGDLDGALAVRGEKERIEKGQVTTPELRSSMPPNLRSWRDKYETTTRLIDGEQTKADQAAKAKYVQELQALEVSLTKGGQLEAAIAARTERSKLSASSAEAGPAVAGGTPAALAPAGPVPGSTSAPFDLRAATAAGTVPPGNSFAPSNATVSPNATAGASGPLAERLTNGVWKMEDNRTFSFRPDGTIRMSWNSGARGHWKITGPLAIEFNLSESAVRKGRITQDMKKLTFDALPSGRIGAEWIPKD